MFTTAQFQLGQVEVVLIGDEGLEAIAIDVGEGELGSRMRALPPADGSGALRPGAQVEVVELAESRPPGEPGLPW